MTFSFPILIGAILLNGGGIRQDQPNEAEKRYDTMIETVMGAKSLEIPLRVEVKSNGKVIRTQTGKMLTEAPNSIYFKMDTRQKGKRESVVLVCDGIHMKVDDGPAQPAPEQASQKYQAYLVTFGIGTYLNIPAVRGVAAEQKEYSFGRKETVRGARTQAIQYLIDLGKAGYDVRTTVWIDVKTHLPVKRVTVLKVVDESVVVSEIYGAIKMNEKIKPKTFAVPAVSDDLTPEQFKKHCDDHLEKLTEKHAKEWGLGKAQRWDMDLDEGTLTWTFADKVVTAPIQVVGTYAVRSKTFLWGWDHPSISEPLSKHAALTKAYGEKKKIKALTQRKIVCTEEEAWTFTAMAVELGKAQGAYRGSAGKAYIYFTFGKVVIWEKKSP